MGEHGTAIKIKLRAPAVEGKANAALRSFLAEVLQISESEIVLEHGNKSREKLIRIDGLSEEDVRAVCLGPDNVSGSGFDELVWFALAPSPRFAR